MIKKLNQEFNEFRLLLRAVPSTLLVFFVIAIFSMNLLANKSLNVPFAWLALDCGFIVSWFAFLTNDIISTYFGPKAAMELSVFATAVNLFLSLIFYIGSSIPGVWGESYVEGSEQIINSALDHTFGGTWYILVGSTIAFLVSALVNNFLNYGIGKLFQDPDSKKAYMVRVHISTALGQFVDNLTFALLVSHVFFGWSLLQCITCAITGMVVELICESLFSGLGYRFCQNMRKEKIGTEYLNLMKQKRVNA